MSKDWEWLNEIESRDVIFGLGQKQKCLKAIHLLRESLEFYSHSSRYRSHDLLTNPPIPVIGDCLIEQGSKARETLSKLERGEF